MCETCGCGDPNIVPVDVHADILEGNNRTAAHNREHFREHGACAVNLMGSPGSGKTALLEATARRLGAGGLAALAGDVATDRDAARLLAAGIRALPITTGAACHLDAAMVHHALHHFPLRGVEFLFIENVGNLVCPAIYDLGQQSNVVALSVTEGEDKPLKYPAMFRRADLVVVTKVDLLPHLPQFRLEALQEAVARVMPDPRILLTSTVRDTGIDEWCVWLQSCRHAGAGAAMEVPA
jgi:hydrogenase nickel incorporation protein HypB